jgi:gas vesicle protein
MADDNGNSFLWFLAGLGLGAVVGVLYAPKPGRETRDDIRQRADEGRDFVVNRAKQGAEQAQQWMDKGREIYESQREQFKSAVEAGKEAYRDATGQTGRPGEP